MSTSGFWSPSATIVRFQQPPAHTRRVRKLRLFATFAAAYAGGHNAGRSTLAARYGNPRRTRTAISLLPLQLHHILVLTMPESDHEAPKRNTMSLCESPNKSSLKTESALTTSDPVKNEHHDPCQAGFLRRFPVGCRGFATPPYSLRNRRCHAQGCA